MSSVVNSLAEASVEHGAEDLFLKAGSVPYARISGRILKLGDQLVSRSELAAFWTDCHADPEERREFDTSWTSSGGHRFRVNLFHEMGQLGAALRPIKTEIPAMSDLGLPANRLEKWLDRRSGLILFTGPTASGKSTSLAACLDFINQNDDKHILTIEDPIEYLLTPSQSVVTQRQVGTDTETFVSGLRAALRQSPDVILVGEIRDPETARIALQAAETGHLVFSTMHCSDVSETLERLMALFSPAEREAALLVLSKQLVGIVSQQLLPSTSERLILVVEHLENSGAVRKWLREGDASSISEFLNRGGSGGNVRFIDSIVEAFRMGRMDEEVARSACRDPHEFDRIQLGISTGHR